MTSAPSDTQLLEDLAAIWAKILGVKKVNPEDNFFALGGHSLLAVKLIAEIQEKMDVGAELNLADVLEFPTLGAFAENLKSLMKPSEEWGQI